MNQVLKQSMARNGSNTITGAASTVAGREYCALIALEETVISACTELPQNSDGDTSFTGTLTAGTTLLGLFTGVTITSGTLRCVLASPNAQ